MLYVAAMQASQQHHSQSKIYEDWTSPLIKSPREPYFHFLVRISVNHTYFDQFRALLSLSLAPLQMWGEYSLRLHHQKRYCLYKRARPLAPLAQTKARENPSRALDLIDISPILDRSFHLKRKQRSVKRYQQRYNPYAAYAAYKHILQPQLIHHDSQ